MLTSPALGVADVPLIVPRLDDPSFGPRLLEVCREHRVGLVFPLIDPDVPVLTRMSADLAAIGARVGTVSPDDVETVSDKWQTYQFFNSVAPSHAEVVAAESGGVALPAWSIPSS